MKRIVPFAWDVLIFAVFLYYVVEVGLSPWFLVIPILMAIDSFTGE